MYLKKFPFLADEPGATGGDADRGDAWPPAEGVEVEKPAVEKPGDKAAEALTAELNAEAAATAAAEAAAAEAAAEADPAAAAAEAADKTRKKDDRIPLSRHEAILTKEREKRADLERQLSQFQQGGQIATLNENITAAENKILELEKEYGTQLTDGDVDKAAVTMATIRRLERDMNEAKSDMKIQAAESRATERARYNIALERIETSFPVLNPDHADYDEAVMDEVAELKAAYEGRGLTPTAALQKAVKLIVGATNTKQEVATTSTPRVATKDAAGDRKAAATTKAAAAVGKTPASLATAGVDGDKMGGKITADQAIKLPQDQFAKLDEATLRSMRGDEL